MQWIWIGLGGMLGTLGRYAIDGICSKHVPFPYSIFIVNVLGCFLLGVFTQLSISDNSLKNALTIGLCGGLTTFSTFSQQNLYLLQQGDYVNFTVYSFGSLAIGILSFWLATKCFQ